jgi:hypothetical protein
MSTIGRKKKEIKIIEIEIYLIIYVINNKPIIINIINFKNNVPQVFECTLLE